MSELRQDPITGGWVIISPRRNKRPFDFVSEREEHPWVADQGGAQQISSFTDKGKNECGRKGNL